MGLILGFVMYCKPILWFGTDGKINAMVTIFNLNIKLLDKQAQYKCQKNSFLFSFFDTPFDFQLHNE
jgi:hypothetical protein